MHDRRGCAIAIQPSPGTIPKHGHSCPWTPRDLGRGFGQLAVAAIFTKPTMVRIAPAATSPLDFRQENYTERFRLDGSERRMVIAGSRK
jgi:hypothetical protein